MLRFRRFILITLVLLAIASVRPVAATSDLTAHLACDPDGLQESGAVYRICMPTFPPWNGELVVYAHGYVSPTEPVGIPEDQMTLPGTSTTLDQIVNSMGYAFATTSYSTNGLAVVEGIADLVDLVDIFTTQKGAPDTVYLIGGSEGGLITTLAVERYPDVFGGGLAMCGPYGDFGRQINYFGDFRVVFDYFFPGLLPDSPVDIPGWLLEDWDTYYETTIKPEIEDPANAGLLEQLLSVTNAPYDTEDASTKEATIPSPFSGTTSSLPTMAWTSWAANLSTIRIGSTPAPTTTSSSNRGCSVSARTRLPSTRSLPITRPPATSACPWSRCTPLATTLSPTGTPPAIVAKPSPPTTSPSTSTSKLTATVTATSQPRRCCTPSPTW